MRHTIIALVLLAGCGPSITEPPAPEIGEGCEPFVECQAAECNGRTDAACVSTCFEASPKPAAPTELDAGVCIVQWCAQLQHQCEHGSGDACALDEDFCTYR